jgi:hypothetical protein
VIWDGDYTFPDNLGYPIIEHIDDDDSEGANEIYIAGGKDKYFTATNLEIWAILNSP